LVGEEDELVDDKDITVWIDPLDATQEYTGATFYIFCQFYTHS